MLFPKTTYVERLTINEQIEQIASEYGEVLGELANTNVNYTSVAMELWDVVQACETALRILEEQHSVDVNHVRQYVYEKNKARGYYL